MKNTINHPVGAHKWACNNTLALCRILYFFHSPALVACKCGLIHRYVEGERHEENNQIHHLTGRTLAIVGMMFAQAPVVDIDRYRHGNLASAQSDIVQAYQNINTSSRMGIAEQEISSQLGSV